MPAAGRVTHHPDTRLPQRVALGVLLRSFPPVRVDEVLEAAGRREQRTRLLPARLMVYFTLGMWIFKSLPYELILAEILHDAPGLGPPLSADERASAAAIGRARRRLGVEPLKLLFDQAVALADAEDAEARRRRGPRPVRLCRVEIGVPATPANLRGFGAAPRPMPWPPGRPARTPLRVALNLLIEEGTGRIVAAEVGDSPQAPLERLLGAVPAQALLVLDERPLDARLWWAAERLGADRLWPLDARTPPSHGTRLPDGSLLAKVAAEDGSELVARVVSRAGQRPLRLATSLLDPRRSPAADLLDLAEAGRGGVGGFDGVGTYGGGSRLELRSKDPEMVCQEIYAMLCVQHAIGDLVGPTP
jgi:hypothetical protein